MPDKDIDAAFGEVLPFKFRFVDGEPPPPGPGCPLFPAMVPTISAPFTVGFAAYLLGNPSLFLEYFLFTQFTGGTIVLPPLASDINVTDDGLVWLAEVATGQDSDNFQDVQMVLFDNNVIVVGSTVWTDLNEASFSGYARLTVGPFSPVTSSPGNAFTQSMPGTFSSTDVSTVQLYGVAFVVVEGPTTRLIAGGLFDGAPYPMMPGQSFQASTILNVG